MIIAAGNEHEKAEAMRRAGDGAQLDTELCCPGQARRALTVGSINKRILGCGAFVESGAILERGVETRHRRTRCDVASTIPVPRGSDGSRLRVRRAAPSSLEIVGPRWRRLSSLVLRHFLAQRMERAGREATPAALRRALMRLSRSSRPPRVGREACRNRAHTHCRNFLQAGRYPRSSCSPPCWHKSFADRGLVVSDSSGKDAVRVYLQYIPDVPGDADDAAWQGAAQLFRAGRAGARTHRCGASSGNAICERADDRGASAS